MTHSCVFFLPKKSSQLLTAYLRNRRFKFLRLRNIDGIIRVIQIPDTRQKLLVLTYLKCILDTGYKGQKPLEWLIAQGIIRCMVPVQSHNPEGAGNGIVYGLLPLCGKT